MYDYHLSLPHGMKKKSLFDFCDTETQKRTVNLILTRCNLGLVCAAHMHPHQVNDPKWPYFQLHYAMNPLSEVRQINKNKTLSALSDKFNMRAPCWLYHILLSNITGSTKSHNHSFS